MCTADDLQGQRQKGKHQRGTSSVTVSHVDKQLQNVSVNLSLRDRHGAAYLNYVEDHILVKTVEDALCDTVVAPRPVDQQKLLQVGELPKKNNKSRRLSVRRKTEAESGSHSRGGALDIILCN